MWSHVAARQDSSASGVAFAELMRSVVGEVGHRLRVLIVAGIPVGVVVAGVGSRLAMLLLRLTSPDRVRGVTSDDGFTIGRFTLGGTYNLLVLGAVVGVIGAAAYRSVAPWLLGPTWFRRGTVASASGVVVGSMLVHADGVDFTVLQPTWLAIGLFVALPALFGLTIACMVDFVDAAGPVDFVDAAGPVDSVDGVPQASAGRAGWRRWVLPVVLVAAFPLSLVIVVLSAVVLAVWVPIRREIDQLERIPRLVSVAVRAGWLAVAAAGLAALVGDIGALT